MQSTLTFCTGPELRALLKISRSTYYRLLDAGLPTIGVGRLRRHPLRVVLKWYDDGANGDMAVHR